MTGLVLYDGACGLCRGAVALLRAAGGEAAFVCLPYQHAADALRRHGLSEAPLEQELHLVRKDGTVLRGFFAVREICWNVPWLWPVTLLLAVPGAAWLGTRVYRFVTARRPRTRIPGGASL